MIHLLSNLLLKYLKIDFHLFTAHYTLAFNVTKRKKIFIILACNQLFLVSFALLYVLVKSLMNFKDTFREFDTVLMVLKEKTKWIHCRGYKYHVYHDRGRQEHVTFPFPTFFMILVDCSMEMNLVNNSPRAREIVTVIFDVGIHRGWCQMDVIKDWAPCHWNMQPGIVMSSEGGDGRERERQYRVGICVYNASFISIFIGYLKCRQE